MIDEALTLVRKLHHVILIVSFGTLLFSLSLVSPGSAIALRDVIGKFMQHDFRGYDEFTCKKVNQYVAERRSVVFGWIGETFGTESSIENLDCLAKRIVMPLHVEKFEVGGTLLTGLKDTTPNELLSKAFFEHLSRPIHITQVDFEKVSTRLEQDLGPFDRGQVNVPLRVQPAEEVKCAHMLSSTGSIELFRLPPWPDPGGELRHLGWTLPPQYDVRVERTSLPASSFIDWVEYEDNAGKASAMRFRKLVSLDSPLRRIPKVQRGGSLEELHENLVSEIAAVDAIGQAVSVYGMRIPAGLAGVAFPVALMMLSYFLAMHTRHLLGIAGDNVDELKEFAWVPLMLRGNISWVSATTSSVVILPNVSLVVLRQKLTTLDGFDLNLLWIAMVCAVLVILTFGLVTLYTIDAIRSKVRARSVRGSLVRAFRVLQSRFFSRN